MTSIPFTKLHGLGNDFVLLDGLSSRLPRITPALARAIADRKRGVGFDQLLVLRSFGDGRRSHDAQRIDCYLDIYNADGSIAEMCGNGLRAAALYLWVSRVAKTIQPYTRRGVLSRAGLPADLVIDTCAGLRRARALGPITSQTKTARIECEMGEPRILPTPRALARGVRLVSKTEVPVCINVGNPHAVSFVYPERDALLAEWGSTLETHRAFPKRTNAEFVRVRSGHLIDVKVWERGVGITEACGTGAVASACAAISKGLVKSPVKVRFPGGEAEVVWAGKGSSAFLRGTAHLVYSGEFHTR